MTQSRLRLTARERSIIFAVRALGPDDVATITAAPQPEKGKWICLGDGNKPCYKAGHEFTKRGMYGDGVTSGHIELKNNENHSPVAI